MLFKCTLIVVCSLFVTEEGALYSCGWGADGQTGLGHYDNTDRISRCVGDIQGVKIVKVSCAADCVLALSGNFVDSQLIGDNYPPDWMEEVINEY